MKKLRFFLYSFLFLVIIILACLYIVPFGQINYKHDFSKNHYNFLGGKGFFHKLGPAERLFDKNKVVGDPAYFYLKTPRTFSEANLKINYRLSPALNSLAEKKFDGNEVISNSNYLNIDLGVLIDKNNWHYNLKPVFNNVLSGLSDDWEKAEISNDWLNDENYNEHKNDKNITLWQKKDSPSLTSDKLSRVTFYNYSSQIDFYSNDNLALLDDGSYACLRYDIRSWVRNLRGSHVFYTSICNEDLEIDFTFSTKDEIKDLGVYNDLAIFVYYQNETIFQDKIISNLDNFNKFDNFEYQLNLPGLPNGAYKVELRLNDSIIIDKMETDLNKISFLNKVWLDDLNDGLLLYSNKNNFRVKSINSDCLGDLKINEEIFNVDKIYQQFNFNLSDSSSKSPLKNLNKIYSNSCGLIIENNGLFSFAEMAFINPLPNRLDQETNLGNFDYILADYNPPIKNNNIYSSEIKFNLSSAWRDKDGYTFIISAPFLKDLNSEKYIEIVDIEIELRGKSLVEKIKDIIRNFKN